MTTLKGVSKKSMRMYKCVRAHELLFTRTKGEKSVLTAAECIYAQFRTL